MSLARIAWVMPMVVVLGRAAPVQAQGRRASDSEACFESAERAQPLLKDRKLRAAARELGVCARDICPHAARTDCRAWLEELTRVQPTVVFRAREARQVATGGGSGGGGDVAVDDVSVSVDGEPLVNQIDESPVPIDPGTRTLRFEHAGFPTVEQRIDLREGELRRVVDVVFRRPDTTGAGAAQPPLPPAATAMPGPSSSRPPVTDRPEEGAAAAPVPASVWALLGGAAIALGVGITFEAVGLSSRSQLADSCGPSRSCAPSDVDSARTQVLAGDIAIGVSAALLAGAAYLYFARPRGTAGHDTSSLRFGLLPVFGGLAGAIEGSL